MNDIEHIRRAEAASHTKAYRSHELFAPGSWLAKPVRTVLELLTLFEGYGAFRGLDLGCGVGRNAIPVAQHFRGIPCRVDCVDILDLAIEKLNGNARRYGVADAIRGTVSSIDGYEIDPDSYDLILAVSALEHTDSEAAFAMKLLQIRDGLRPGGVACLIVNSGVRERDKTTGEDLPPQFEVNLETDTLASMMEQVFGGWQRIKHTVVPQKYDIPRQSGPAELEADVVTWVVRRNGGTKYETGL